MLTPYKVRITVVKKTFHEDLVDEYTEGVKWEPKNCCHAFEIGHEFISDGHMPEGFSDWAWTDIQKYVMTLARGGNMLGVKSGIFISNCTDGFRPVSFKMERIEDE